MDAQDGGEHCDFIALRGFFGRKERKKERHIDKMVAASCRGRRENFKFREDIPKNYSWQMRGGKGRILNSVLVITAQPKSACCCSDFSSLFCIEFNTYAFRHFRMPDPDFTVQDAKMLVGKFLRIFP